MERPGINSCSTKTPCLECRDARERTFCKSSLYWECESNAERQPLTESRGAHLMHWLPLLEKLLSGLMKETDRKEGRRQRSNHSRTCLSRNESYQGCHSHGRLQNIRRFPSYWSIGHCTGSASQVMPVRGASISSLPYGGRAAEFEVCLVENLARAEESFLPVGMARCNCMHVVDLTSQLSSKASIHHTYQS